MKISPLLPSLLLGLGVLEANAFEPLLTVPADVVVESDFSADGKALIKKIWQPRQNTRWEIADGVLRGVESTPENQAAKKDHRGLEPRLSVPATPAEFMATFEVRFVGGEETDIVPFVEFGHHIVRLKFSSTEGLVVLVDYESLKVAEAADFKFRPGEWIRMMAELKGGEFVVQIENGPTLHAAHPVLSEPAPSGGSGLGVAGPRGGVVELDNVKIYTVKAEEAAGWSEKAKTFPSFDPVVVREKPKK